MTERLEIKASLAVNEAGDITGNAWPFNSPDSVGDVIQKGAINIAVSDLPILFGHNPDDLIGTWIETKQTDDGLIVAGKLHMDQPRARSVRAMIQGGLVSGLSIGFRTREAKQQGRNRVISALDLLEISVVRNPSHPKARISSAKQFDSASAIAAALNRAAAHFTK
jgi:HK97 family phage prohead protease